MDILASLSLSEGYLPIPEFPDGIIPVDFELEPFVLKMGYATVDILGQILAGGSVRVGSELNTVVNTTNGIASIVVPIAVGVAVGESSVTVGGDALIQAGASAQLDAYSDTRITADTTSGLPKFSLSLSVAALDTHVTVGGNARIEAQGNVDLVANGNVVTGAYATGRQTSALGYQTPVWRFYCRNLH